MIYMVRILKDIHNHFGIYLHNKVGDIQATTQHKTKQSSICETHLFWMMDHENLVISLSFHAI